MDNSVLSYGWYCSWERCDKLRATKYFRRRNKGYCRQPIFACRGLCSDFCCSSKLRCLSCSEFMFRLINMKQVISTFISHTIASVLLVPIAKEVANSLPGNHQRLLIFLTGLVCSTGMGMPVSGFPNQTA